MLASGSLFMGMSTTASADHQSGVDIEVSTPRIYTRFSTGLPHGYYPYFVPGAYYAYAPPPVPVYVPGYWTWNPARVYWDDGHRQYDEPRHHGHGKHHHRKHRHDRD
jgi:hypothetical protein